MEPPPTHLRRRSCPKPDSSSVLESFGGETVTVSGTVLAELDFTPDLGIGSGGCHRRLSCICKCRWGGRSCTVLSEVGVLPVEERRERGVEVAPEGGERASATHAGSTPLSDSSGGWYCLPSLPLPPPAPAKNLKTERGASVQRIA